MRDVVLWVVIAIAFWTVTIVTLFLLGRKVAARRVLELVPASVALFRGLLADPRVSLGSKLALAVGIAWIVSPIDLIPEFVPFFGPLDDAIVCVLVVRYVVRHAGTEVVGSHWRGDQATLKLLLRIAGVTRHRIADPVLT